ncbi:Deoxynucleoside triphosphate triphosphohydrolase SAMHD1 [Portunus trituberculatus]|uniref:Deoxynucleoside triphosphate triphosphohydrolase SAMHD1 n=1 Tax=Portunus trituberculatus TaxID=210409 RepID=A0A5B7JNS4_PORTR|nr:Deoxynucleoside triphosphate triphosphohydrolase SAMHD1 [Portunus trituberculatus]
MLTSLKYLFQHENASIKMFDYLLETNNLIEEFDRYGLKDQDITFIKEMIYSVPGNGSEWWYKGRPRKKAFLYQVSFKKVEILSLPYFDQKYDNIEFHLYLFWHFNLDCKFPFT